MPPAPVYAVHPSIRLMAGWIDALKAKTGRSVDEWVALARRSGPQGEAARTAWFRSEHGLSPNAASWLAARATTPGAGDEDTPEGYLAAAPGWVEAQYAGKRSALRPIYDRLLELGLGAGPGARACPCRTMVPLFREHVFAQIKPATSTRVDLGLALGTLPASKIPARLIDTGGKARKDRITHRIPLSSVDEIDGFVERWLRTAFELDAPKGAARAAESGTKPRARASRATVGTRTAGRAPRRPS